MSGRGSSSLVVEFNLNAHKLVCHPANKNISLPLSIFFSRSLRVNYKFMAYDQYLALITFMFLITIMFNNSYFFFLDKFLLILGIRLKRFFFAIPSGLTRYWLRQSQLQGLCIRCNSSSLSHLSKNNTGKYRSALDDRSSFFNNGHDFPSAVYKIADNSHIINLSHISLSD